MQNFIVLVFLFFPTSALRLQLMEPNIAGLRLSQKDPNQQAIEIFPAVDLTQFTRHDFDEMIELTGETMMNHVISDNITFTPDVRDKWKQTFDSYSGRSMLLTGDSLCRNHYEAIQQACRLLGGSFDVTNEQTYLWNKDGRGTSITKGRVGKGNFPVQGVLTESFFRLPDNVTFTMAYLDHYQFANDCLHCENQYQDLSNQVLSILTFQRMTKGLLMSIPAFIETARRFDHIISNIGHCSLISDCDMKAMTRMVIEPAIGAGVHHKLALLEHPAQHFVSVDEGGNWNSNTWKGQKECRCYAREKLARQTTYMQNQAMAQVAHEFGVPVIGLWEQSANDCKEHNPPDCTHYKLEWDLKKLPSFALP